MTGKLLLRVDEIGHFPRRQSNRFSTVLLKHGKLAKPLSVSLGTRSEELAPVFKRTKIENKFVFGTMTIRKDGEFRLFRTQSSRNVNIPSTFN